MEQIISFYISEYDNNKRLHHRTEDPDVKRQLAIAYIILKYLVKNKKSINWYNASTLAAGSNIPVGWNWKSLKDYFETHWKIEYHENTRESFRAKDKNGFLSLVDHNNLNALVIHLTKHLGTTSPRHRYKVRDDIAAVFQAGSKKSQIALLEDVLEAVVSIPPPDLAAAMDITKITVTVKNPPKLVKLSPGEHHMIIKNIVEEIVPTYLPADTECISIDDTGGRLFGYTNTSKIKELGLGVKKGSKQPDVMFYSESEQTIYLFEAIYSSGEFDPGRVESFKELFMEKGADLKLLFFSVFHKKAISRVKNVARGTAIFIV